MAAQLKKKQLAAAKKATKSYDKAGLELEAVIGSTANANSLAYDSVSDVVAYAAGSTVVVYSPRKNKQTGFLLSKNNKKIASLGFSRDGKFIAAGECGHTPSIVVWEVATQQVVAELKGQKYGIQCVAFSPNGKHLVSVGFQHDASLLLWDWRAAAVLSVHRLSAKVNSLCWAEDSSHFVTASQNGIRYWYLDSKGKDRTARKGQLETKSIIFNEQWVKEREIAFVSVAITSEGILYGLSTDGLLVAFDSQTREPAKWVSLKVSRAHSMTLTDKYIACACSGSTIRVMDAKTLEHVSNIPKPAPLPRSGTEGADVFPDAVACLLYPDSEKLIAQYADRSFFIWDISKPKLKIARYRSLQAHSDAVYDVQMYRGPAFPEGTFVTSSADGSVCFWNLDAAERSAAGSIHARELLYRLSLNPTATTPKSLENDADVAEPRNEFGIRAIKISPDGELLASGDRQGNLRVHNLLSKTEVDFKEAHDNEVLALDFSPSIDGHVYLASGGRDRLIHIFDTNADFKLVETHDDHSSSITAVKFAQTDDSFRLLSSSADKSVIFRSIQTRPGFKASRYHQAMGPYGTIFDMAVEPSLDDVIHHQKHLVTASQDKRLSLYSIASGKTVRSHKLEEGAGETTRVSLDRAGMFVACASTDRQLRLYELASGELVTKTAGHGEQITGMQWTPDCRRLISTAGDGCVFVWRLSADLTQAIVSRLAGVSAVKGALHEQPDDKAFLFSESPLPGWAKKGHQSRLAEKHTAALLARGKWASRAPEELLLYNADITLHRSAYRRLSFALDKAAAITAASTAAGTNKENFKMSDNAVPLESAKPALPAPLEKSSTVAEVEPETTPFVEEPKTDFQVSEAAHDAAATSNLLPKKEEKTDEAEATAVTPEEFFQEQQQKQPEPAPAVKNLFAVDDFADPDAEFAMFAAPEPSNAAKNRRLSISSSFRSRVASMPKASTAAPAVPVAALSAPPAPLETAPAIETAPVAATTAAAVTEHTTATVTASSEATGAAAIVAGLNTKRDEISSEVQRARARLARLGLLPAGLATAVSSTSVAAPAGPAPVVAVAPSAPAAQAPLPAAAVEPAAAARLVSAPVAEPCAPTPAAEPPEVPAAAEPVVSAEPAAAPESVIEEASEESEHAAEQPLAEEAEGEADADAEAEAEGDTELAGVAEEQHTAEAGGEEEAAAGGEEENKPANLEIYYEAITKLEENFDMILIVHQHLKEQRAKGNVDDLLEKFNSLFVKMQERLQAETAHSTFNSAIEQYSTLLVDAVKKKLEKL